MAHGNIPCNQLATCSTITIAFLHNCSIIAFAFLQWVESAITSCCLWDHCSCFHNFAIIVIAVATCRILVIAIVIVVIACTDHGNIAVAFTTLSVIAIVFRDLWNCCDYSCDSCNPCNHSHNLQNHHNNSHRSWYYCNHFQFCRATIVAFATLVVSLKSPSQLAEPLQFTLQL